MAFLLDKGGENERERENEKEREEREEVKVSRREKESEREYLRVSGDLAEGRNRKLVLHYIYIYI